MGDAFKWELTYIDKDHIGVSCNGRIFVLRERGEDGQIWWDIFYIDEYRIVDSDVDAPYWQDSIGSFEAALECIPDMIGNWTDEELEELGESDD